MFDYNKLKDDILNWDGVNFPTDNRDIDRFEENNKLVLINVFDFDDCLNDNKIILHRGTKNRNAKYEIDLLKYLMKTIIITMYQLKTKVDYLTAKAIKTLTRNIIVIIA